METTIVLQTPINSPVHQAVQTWLPEPLGPTSLRNLWAGTYDDVVLDDFVAFLARVQRAQPTEDFAVFVQQDAGLDYSATLYPVWPPRLRTAELQREIDDLTARLELLHAAAEELVSALDEGMHRDAGGTADFMYTVSKVRTAIGR